jgi:hypothetical protein
MRSSTETVSISRASDIGSCPWTILMLEDCCQASESKHLLIRVGGDMTIDRALQFIKGGSSLSIKDGIPVCGRGLAARIFAGAGR